ncbi:MAG: hypothetical protein KDC44_17715 [Phaeodactylibacter sp.]|nr:hypothetical protein [Phaeodactylibacter sp.]
MKRQRHSDRNSVRPEHLPRLPMLYLLFGWLLIQPGYLCALPGSEDTRDQIEAGWDRPAAKAMAFLSWNGPGTAVAGLSPLDQAPTNFEPERTFLLGWQCQRREFLSFCPFTQLHFLNRKIFEAYPDSDTDPQP